MAEIQWDSDSLAFIGIDKGKEKLAVLDVFEGFKMNSQSTCSLRIQLNPESDDIIASCRLLNDLIGCTEEIDVLLDDEPESVGRPWLRTRRFYQIRFRGCELKLLS